MSVLFSIHRERSADAASIYQTLGTVCRNQHDLEKSCLFFDKALNIRIKLDGLTHPGTADVYLNMGLLNLYEGNFEKVLDCMSLVRKSILSQPGEPDNYRLAECYNIIGYIEVTRGRNGEAFAIAEKNKAYVMFQNLTEIQARQLAGIPDGLLDREKNLKSESDFCEKCIYEERAKGANSDPV